MISFEDEDVKISDRLKELAKEAVEASLDRLAFDYECDISITTTDNARIQSINKEFRDLDQATDVLSFPMIEWPKPCDYEYFENNIRYFVDQDTEGIVLGDIVLSMDKVKEQAEEFEHSFEREFAFLIVHSMLHLFGYDHMTLKDEEEMIDLQKQIMTKIQYER
ncbi:MAG: rRNA maturation RNase YbeY [Vallitaleaceae bacterium]|nr:rRNA maturation RNase YbeY [Vallitaleaceae bacterium]